MSAFRAFMIYDYQRSFFFLFIRRGFQVSPKWNDCRKELENKLKEIVKEPKDIFQQSSEYGMFRCKYDKKNKCYFILLSSNEVQEAYQNQVLDEIYQTIEKEPNYSKIKKEELEQKETETIKNLIETKENDYIQKYGKVKAFEEPHESKIHGQNQQQSNLQSQQQMGSSIIGTQNQRVTSQIPNTSAIQNKSQGFNSDKDLSSDTLIKLFRCFMMWDYNRQFFFMFIRRGFPIDKTWSQERVKLEEQLKAKQLDPNDPKAKPKEPPELFDYRGNFGQYKAKYDKKTKCYFILLSRFKIKEDPQIKLLDALYDEIQKVDKYITLKYDALEDKKKKQLEKIIDEYEKETSNQVNQRFVDTKVIEQKLGFLTSPERNIQRDPEESAIQQNGRVSNNDTSQIQFQMLTSNKLQQTQPQETIINSSKLLQSKSIYYQQQQQPQQQQQQQQQQQEILLKQEKQEIQNDYDPIVNQDNPDLISNQDNPENIPINLEVGEQAQRLSLYYTKPLNISSYIKSGN